MKPLRLLPALAMALLMAMPAAAQGRGHGWGQPYHAGWHGHAHKAPVRFVPVVQPVLVAPFPAPVVVTRRVPVFVPTQRVVYKRVPVQQPRGSVTIRVNL
jgi:hypothetical protein